MRSHTFRAVATFVLTIGFFSTLPASAQVRSISATLQVRSADWPQIGFDAGRTGYNPHETILGPSTIARLKLRWIKTDAGYPVVGKGLLYADSGGLIAAFDPISGTLRWESDPTDYTVAFPEYDAGRVYATGYGPELYALNASTGAQLWYGGAGGGAFAPPAIMRGVYVNDSYDETFAEDEGTGELRWWGSVGGDHTIIPAAANGLVFVGTAAVTASTGKIVWSGISASHLMVAEGVLYTASGSNVSAYTAANGAPLWTTNVGGSTALAIANGVVYAGNGLSLTALEAATGSPLWTSQAGGANPAVANGVVYAGSADGLVAIDAGSGALLWSRKVPGAVVSQIIVNGMLYATAVDADVSSIYAFGL